MKYLLVSLIYLSSTIETNLAQGIDFGEDEAPHAPAPTPGKIITASYTQSDAIPKGESKCACVPKERCAEPGVIPNGPRLEGRSLQVDLGDEDGQEEVTFSPITLKEFPRIINNPPPAPPSCMDSVYCCNIIPPVVEIVVPIEEKQFTCGTRSFIAPRYPKPEAEFGEYPWMALILKYEDNKSRPLLIASGALLDDFTVLTTAHNVQGFLKSKSLKVRVGDLNLDSGSEPFPFVEVDVDRIIIHEDFDWVTLRNDIALVKLDPSCRLRRSKSTNINSICLPQQRANFENQRSSCWVPGYGITENGKAPPILRHVDVKLLTGDKCQDLLQKTILGKGFTLSKNSFICAGGEEGKDSCRKDGGSALVCQRPDGRWHVAGLVSWGIDCARPDVPGVYTNVPNYIDWIENNRVK